ncbi:DUF86 domain-containing protein [Halarcobacter ebronensis]|uniref:Antitoxin n=1 Tax=Halarcobacter ebronensis TaxID=1462615 RepID=A0A4V1M0G1_9BACT|nr:HepT-like ribonuclease domain-containing protein [Halarcobacter ebronensis]QKF81554.1 DUF86 domain-containing protein [Halarcobacter ebronensis]RXK05482.1 antitoxin [Halarcobacter ebronensis]
MYDKSLVFEILSQVENSIQITLKRFEVVDDVDYFTNTSIGMEKLDSICMQLIAIGESLKNIDKITDKELLEKYPQIDWRGAKGMRDIISHHYFDIDAKEIYDVCDSKLESLLETIKLIKQEL